ncbi:insulinase family protein [Pedobacter frigiditerrae]|uniref:Insulinase family protein n=1 Tax=Pedobacter frigiditerrae TaxID=2530452 RepID=A0A4R0N407_9SPHI|nr:insulinase family protein [Pedobacter frigiditerrae]TCC93232.1 insulinase family protein [Pedobacter frigiditerrae]
MKSITKIAILFIALLSFTVASAQNSMKAPVRFKLKNGITVIVAQNNGLGKIYSRLTIENQTCGNKVIAQVFENYLNNKATKFNDSMSATGATSSKVTFAYNEANTATNTANFEPALNYVSTLFLNPTTAKQAFDEMKSLYTGNKADLDSITAADVQDYYNKSFKASDTFITIAGDITPSDAKEIASKAFGSWNVVATL